MEHHEQLFGTKAIRKKGVFFVFLKRFLTLQTFTFWVFTYLVSIAIFYFFSMNLPFIDIMNLIFFPFSLILLGSIGNRFYFSVPFLHTILYPSLHKKHYPNNGLAKIILYIVKVILFYFVWFYSFFIGIIGLLLSIHHTRILVK